MIKGVLRVLLLHFLLLFVSFEGKSQDTDGDAIANATDPDDDNDGIPDEQEGYLQLSNYLPSCTGSATANFSGPATLESGTEKKVGAIYRFTNVFAGTDALVEIELMKNISDINIDNNATGSAAAFQPSSSISQLPQNEEAYTQYKITFVNSGTNTVSRVGALFANFADIDGNETTSGDLLYFSDHSSYTLQETNTLTVVNSAYDSNVNWTKATAGTTEVDLMDTLIKSAAVTAKFANFNSFRIRVGLVSRNATASVDGRIHRVDFTCPLQYTSPNTFIVDFDEDGIRNTVDLDSDNDGISDLTEAGGSDPDNNGMIAAGAAALTILDTDKDNNPDYIDLDSDGDGISDLVEGQTTVNFVALANSDDDKDGIDNSFEKGFLVPANTDGSDTPDFIDLDSDGDTQADSIEAWDSDKDGISNKLPLGKDIDSDGIDDGYDAIVTAVNPGNGQTPATFPNSAGTDERDWREPYIDKPIALGDKVSATEDSPILLADIFKNDIRSDDGPSATSALSITVKPTNGEVTIDDNGTPADATDDKFTYTPSLNYSGTDSFVYQVCDLQDDCDTALVSINVTSVNDKPSATDLYGAVDPAVTLSLNVSKNVSDVDPNTVFSYKIVSAPIGSTATIDPKTGLLSYTPSTSRNPRQDTVVYAACDNGSPEQCGNGRVIVTVPDAVTTKEDSTATFEVTGNNIDLASVAIVTGPKNGVATVTTSTGVINYTPLADFNGLDSVEYKFCDKTANCENAWIIFLISAVNDAPVVDNESHTIDEDNTVTGDLTNEGDSDLEGTDLAAGALLLQPANGKVDVKADGSYTYTPNLNYYGNDVFVVQVCDAGLPLPGSCVNDTVFITINPVNDPPTAISDRFDAGIGGEAVTGNFNANNTDPEGTTITVGTVVSPAMYGAFSSNPDGSFRYTPSADSPSKLDKVVVEVCDNSVPPPVQCTTDTIYFTIKQFLFISEGFAPNGTNNTFIIETIIPGAIDVKIYNRWGGLVYENSDYRNNFTGISNAGTRIGEELPEGTYFYEITFGNGVVRRSYITILR